MSDAFMEGYEARGCGDYINPYEHGEVEYDEWNRGYAEADAALAEAGVDFL